MEDVKNTKEVMIAFLKISVLLAESFKDGIQASDFIQIANKIYQSEELKKALFDAYNDIEKLPAEIKDIKAGEAVELLAAATPELANLIKAIA